MRKLSCVMIFMILFAVAAIFSACSTENAPPSLEYITLDTSAVSSDYSVGDKFIPSQVKITAHKSDGTSETFDCEASMLSGADTSTPGEKTVKVSYQGCTQIFSLFVGGIKRYESTDEGYIEGKTTQKIPYNGTGTRVIAMAYEGYEFSHWSDGVTSAERRDTNVVDFSLVTANFKPAEFTVTFVDKSGNMIASKTVAYGEEALPLDYTREGFYISSYSINGGRNLSSLKVRGNTTITVGFKSIEHTVRFEGGYDFQSRVFNYGDKIVFPTPKQEEGQVFAGWADSDGKIYSSDYKVVEDLHLFAVYSFKVTLSVGNIEYSYLLNEGDPFSISDDIVVPEGYSIKAVYDSEGLILDENYRISRPESFYAVLEIALYEISFIYPQHETTVSVEYGEKLKLPSQVPNTEGKTFLYWEKQGEPYDFSLPVKESFVLSPKWETVTITVSFLEVMGQSVKTESFEYGTVLGDLYLPERKDQPQFTFDGWFYDTQYKTPYQGGITLTHDLYFYAKWKTTTFTPSFEVGEGGSYRQLSSAVIPYGGTLQFEVRADVGYHIASIFFGDTQLPVDYQPSVITKTLTDIVYEPSIRIYFEPNEYTVTVASSAFGTASKTEADKMRFGEVFSVSFTPINGYVLDKITVNGVSYPAPIDNFFTLKITQNANIVPVYALKKFAVSFVGDNFNVEGGEKIIYIEYGASKTVRLTAYSNFVISKVSLKGCTDAFPQAPEHTVEIVDVSSDITVYVETKGDRVLLSLSGGGVKGKITSDGSDLTDVTQIYVDFGDIQVFEFVPNIGYYVKDVIVNGISKGSISSFEYTPIRRSGDKIEVYFGLKIYDITVRAEANGKVTPNGITRVEHGGSVSITATPNEHYLVSSYRINSEIVKVGQESFTLNLENVTENQAIVFLFEVKRYTLELTANNGGNVIVTNSGNNSYLGNVQHEKYQINYGNTVNIMAEYGHHISALVIDGTAVEIDFGNNTSFYSVGIMYDDVDIEVEFEPNTYSISGNSGVGGRVVAPGYATYGVPLVLQIVPDEGYYLSSFTVDGITRENAESYTFAIVTSDMVYTAEFEIFKYSVSVTASEGGTFDDYPVMLDYGEELSIAFKAKDHYYVDTVLINGKEESLESNAVSYTVHIPKMTEDVVIDVRFALETFKVFISYNEGGCVEVDNTVIASGEAHIVYYGEYPVYYFLAAVGYEVESVRLNGVEQSGYSSLSLEYVNSDMNIEVKFKIKRFSISVTPASGGRIEVSETTLSYGESLTVTVTPDQGYEVAWVKINGRTVSLENNIYVLSSVSKNVLITASFRKI